MSEQRRSFGADRAVRRGRLLLVAGFLASASADTVAQTPNPVFKLDHLVGTMKVIGRNVAAGNGSLTAGDFPTAKAQFTRVREQLAPTITFWRDHKKDDAIRMLRDALAKLDALDAALSGDSVDAAAAGALAKQVGAACQSCHAVYREQDPNTKAYRLKPGSLQ